MAVSSRHKSNRELPGDCKGYQIIDAPVDNATQQQKKLKDACVGCAKFTFSSAGMLLVAIAYSIAGAFLFQWLESANEIATCYNSYNQYLEVENNTQQLLMDIAYDVNKTPLATVDKDIRIQEKIQEMLQNFSTSSLDIGYKWGNNCSTLGALGGSRQNWSWIGSLFFSITVITTIGYGNFAPATGPGRIVSIVFASIGIPILLSCLANIGMLMAKVFRFVYASFCCCGCCNPSDHEDLEESTPIADKADDKKLWATDSTGRPFQDSKTRPAVIQQSEEPDAEEEVIAVPLTISILAIAIFVMIGGATFSVWEDWTYVNASYFCFITLATIGFGDIVPGYASLDSSDALIEIVFTSTYMVLGMAMVSMCFELMQDEMISKIHWVSTKIGLRKSQHTSGDAVKIQKLVEEDKR